jgi:hypothetical protein
MKTEFKDYQLYLGCEVKVPDTMHEGMYFLSGIITKQIPPNENIIRLQLWNLSREQIYWLDADVCTLVLRKLSSMTEEEKKVARDIYYTDKIELLAIMDVAHFELCRYLLSCGFDLFGLIDSGLAIEKQS